ncbi:MAG: MGMT family protein [Arenicellales bacterium]|nr:MGMT family protein [Arenicellales bacterium]
MTAGLYARIYRLVCTVPRGQVATYGQLGAVVGCSARQVGYAMAAVTDVRVPWHRVINSRGAISTRSDGKPDTRQRELLESETVVFGPTGCVDLATFGWNGPDWDWLVANGLEPPQILDSD